MKQKLLTLLVLLVSTLCAFAQSDATGSGVGSETKNNEGGLGSKGVAYSYTFTESLGAVTLKVVADGTGCSGIPTDASMKTIIYEVTQTDRVTLAEDKDTYTWTGKQAGDVIKVQLEWAVSFGRSASDEFTYTVKGSTDVDTEAPVLTKAEATTVKDTKAILTLCATDNAYSDLTYTVKNDEATVGTVTGAPGKDVTLTIDNLTASTEYTFNVTAKDAMGNVSETKVVTFTTDATIDWSTIEPAATPTATNVFAYYSEHYGQGLTGLEVYGSAWEKGYESSEEIAIANGHKVVRVTGVGTWGLRLAGKDVSAFNKLCTDIYAFEESPFRIIYEDTSVPNYTGTLQKGWNHVEIDMTDYARTSAGYIKITIGDWTNNNKENYTCLFDNIYVAAGAIAFNVATNDNVAKVVGDVTAENVAEINAADAMAIDLSTISSIADDAKIEPLHKNAIILVSGTDGATSIATKFEALKTTKNLVVKGTDGWYRPYTNIEFTDEPGEPLWRGQGIDKDWISSLNAADGHGWKMTHTVKAKSYATIFALTAITDVPKEISIWLAVNYDETTGITFNKTDVIGGAYPYVLYNSGDEDIDLSFGGSGDINFTTDFCKKFGAETTKPVGATEVKFCGNFDDALVTDGTQWIVKNDNASAVIKPANGAKISPFRAYFTGLDAATGEAKLNFIGGEATGINGINAAEAADGAIYNLAGQKVNAAYKGIVIKNGKKFLVK